MTSTELPAHLQFAAQAEHDIAQPPHLGHGRALRSDHHDIHGFITGLQRCMSYMSYTSYIGYISCMRDLPHRPLQPCNHVTMQLMQLMSLA